MTDNPITTLDLPICNCHLIRGEGGYLLVDGGAWFHWPWFIGALRKHSIEPADIRWAVATHCHLDHVGVFARLKELSPECQIYAHAAEADWLREGRVVIPPTTWVTGHALAWLGWRTKWLLAFRAVTPDIRLHDEARLPAGAPPGRIVPTPGHSSGSISVVLDSGHAFVGDLMANRRLTGYGIPIFHDSPPLMFEQWRMLLDAGVHTFHPGHGDAISADLLRTWLA
ncbi:MAG TPA: MBL fold metallo-hydrolase [Armatimonadota bacterium]|jgi:glyoxylase-like metal-dependent hydrolase (beta-lactamase superfamily II)|nr:MBL fold metallo-hydrolase [Armatimonadota bacterium]